MIDNTYHILWQILKTLYSSQEGMINQSGNIWSQSPYISCSENIGLWQKEIQEIKVCFITPLFPEITLIRELIRFDITFSCTGCFDKLFSSSFNDRFRKSSWCNLPRSISASKHHIRPNSGPRKRKRSLCSSRCGNHHTSSLDGRRCMGCFTGMAPRRLLSNLWWRRKMVQQGCTYPPRLDWLCGVCELIDQIRYLVRSTTKSSTNAVR